MRRAIRTSLALSCVLALAGCPGGGDQPPPDSGLQDTGGNDGGMMTDTGTPVMDSGVDGGPLPGDAGPDAGGDAFTPGGDAGLPTDPPGTFTMVSNAGFRSPTDAVSSPDGATFYFGAFDMNDEPAIFSLPSAGGAATALVTGGVLEYPSGLVLSCDGATLYIADPTANTVFSLAVTGGMLTPVAITGLTEPNALAMAPNCSDLVIAGRDMMGEVAVLRAPRAGGAAMVLADASDGLRAPTGVHVDAMNVVWLLDHLAEDVDGPGVLYAVTSGGVATPVVSGLYLGTPGGVSLAAGGQNAVIAARDDQGNAILRVVNTTTMAESTVALPMGFIDPAGLRTARSAGVFAMVDSAGSAIWRGQM